MGRAIDFDQATLLGSVNQQPEYLRPRGTIKDGKNLYPGVADAMARRPPTEVISRIEHPIAPFQLAGVPLMHLVDESDSRRFTLEIGYSHVSGVDLVTGKQLSVRSQSGSVETLFSYLKAYSGAGIPLLGAEDFSGNDGSTQIAPDAAISPPDNSWKCYHSKGAATTVAYTGLTVVNPGPVLGRVSYQTLQTVKSGAGANEDGYFYYQFYAANGENTGFNLFAPAGIYTVFAFYWQNSLANPTPNFEAGFINVDASTFPSPIVSHRAKFILSTLTGTAKTFAPNSTTGTIRGQVEKLKNNWWRCVVAHRSTAAEAAQSMRPFIYFDMPASDGLLTRELRVVGATLEWSKKFAASDFWEQPQKAFAAYAIKDFNFIVNRTKTAAMTTATTGHARMVEFDGTTVAANGATVFITVRGVQRAFTFDSAGPADNPSASPPQYYINTTTNNTTTKATDAFAAKVNEAFADGIARSVKDEANWVLEVGGAAQDKRRIVHLHGVQDLQETGDTGDRIHLHELYEALLWVKGSGPGAQFFLRFKQAAGFVKVGAIAALDDSATGDDLGMPQCLGFTVPGGFTAAGSVANGTACEKTNAVQDYTKGVFFPATAGGGLTKATATQDDSTVTVANELAFRGLAALPAEEHLNGIWPKWVAGSFSILNVVEVVGSVIRLASNAPFTDFQVDDSFGGEALILIRDTVARFTDLPTVGQDGMRIRVKGDNERDIDDYFVKFQAKTAASFGPGAWIEEAADDAPIEIDPTTVPHQVVLKASNSAGSPTGIPGEPYLEYGPIKYVDATGATVGWAQRHAGNTTLAPNPSFIGRKIRDLFFHQLRLGMVASQQLLLSEVDQLFTFFRKTISTEDPADCIDLQLVSTGSYDLSWAEPLGKSLLLGDASQIQAIPSTSQGLTGDTLDRERLLRIRTNEFVRPVAYEQSLFVPFTRADGEFSGVREVFPSPEGETANAEDATISIPTVIAGKILQMAFSPEEGILAVLADGDRSKLYLCHIQKSGGRRILQGWIPYDLGLGLCSGLAFIGSDLYLTVERQYGFFIERVRLRARAKDPGLHYLCHLDRRTGDSSLGFTKAWTGTNTQLRLPYRVDDDEQDALRVVRQFTGVPCEIASVTTVGADTLINLMGAEGDLSLDQEALWVGINYESSGDLHEAHIRESGDGRERSSGTLRLAKALFAVEDTGAIRLSSSVRGADRKSTDFLAGSDTAKNPPAGVPWRFLFTALPAPGTFFTATPPESQTKAFYFQPIIGIETDIVFWIDTSINNTLLLFVTALAELLARVFDREATVVHESGRSIVYLEESGAIAFDEGDDFSNVMTLERGLALEKDRVAIDCAGETSEVALRFESIDHHPFRVVKVDFVPDAEPEGSAAHVG